MATSENPDHIGYVPKEDELKELLMRGVRLAPAPAKGDYKIVLLVSLVIAVPVGLGYVVVLYPWVTDEPDYYMPFLSGFWAWPITVFETYLVLMAYFNYYLACTTPPGKPRSDWQPTRTYPNLPADIDPLRLDRKLQSCLVCNQYKPMRSHHCSKCGSCSLRMDHHCMWTLSCIGYRNHKVFLLFVFHAALASIMAFLFCLMRLYIIIVITAHTYNDMYAHVLPIFVTTFITAGATFFVGGVLMEQATGVFCNVLRIEIPFVVAWEKATMNYLEQNPTDNNTILAWPYFQSYFENACQVLGPSVWMWPFPITSFLSDNPDAATSYYLNPTYIRGLERFLEENSQDSASS
eukprot:CAMPEP_0119145782 /NCGR_PEP_ID=MMETSP1310-20130426/38008_1 /TAXON_ID=464262 /ORGANISM="Genus nov. species nov., Strain RCC2339" /LENGTH=348 /DNA_ID=CAMNT_0007137623 /DNA_START=54 /DNA_END=1097 /DNA_ORIENTATION=+